MEKRDLFLNVLFLYLIPLAAQFSCYEVAATIAQAKPKHLDSLQLEKMLLSIHEKNYSRKYVSQKPNSRKTLPEGNVQRPQLPTINSLIFSAVEPFLSSQENFDY